ncbi:MAG TPA: NAD(P)/FAD-dependent oxidoreductase [Ktedonobacteraceae bacterium]|nr:NAD(P)/FAD-dependent oxidoreductase [Ktedonobacteraceae bacterium]
MEYAVLGGGALGLMAACRLTQAGQEVTVIEQEPLAGGLAAGFQIGDAWLEKFYHHIFRSDTTMIGAINELGLGDRLEWHRPRTVSLVDGALQQLDSPLTLLRFKPWRIDERLRTGAVLAFLKVVPPALLEGQTADPWLDRWMGRRAYSTLFEPLLRGKFGDLYQQISLPWFWARLHDRTTQLGYMRGGFQQFYERLVECIEQASGRVRLGTRVEKVEQQADGRWCIESSGGSLHVDRVISTLPTRLTCRLIPALPETYRAQYDWGQAYGAHCLIVALDRQLTDSYWINMCDAGYPFTSLVEHTNLRAPSEYGGRHLLYFGNYRPMHDPLFSKSKAEVLQEFLPHVKRIVPMFSPDWVTESWMSAAAYAQPIVTTDYRQHIPPLHTPLANLWVANMFQVYPHDRGQNYSLALADTLIEQLHPARTNKFMGKNTLPKN